jgi:hypothetical protein
VADGRLSTAGAPRSGRDNTALDYKCELMGLADDAGKPPLGQGAWVDGFLAVTFHPPYDHGSRAGVT